LDIGLQDEDRLGTRCRDQACEMAEGAGIEGIDTRGVDDESAATVAQSNSMRAFILDRCEVGPEDAGIFGELLVGAGALTVGVEQDRSLTFAESRQLRRKRGLAGARQADEGKSANPPQRLDRGKSQGGGKASREIAQRVAHLPTRQAGGRGKEA